MGIAPGFLKPLGVQFHTDPGFPLLQKQSGKIYLCRLSSPHVAQGPQKGRWPNRASKSLLTEYQLWLAPRRPAKYDMCPGTYGIVFIPEYISILFKPLAEQLS